MDWAFNPRIPLRTTPGIFGTWCLCEGAQFLPGRNLIIGSMAGCERSYSDELWIGLPPGCGKKMVLKF